MARPLSPCRRRRRSPGTPPPLRALWRGRRRQAGRVAREIDLIAIGGMPPFMAAAMPVAGPGAAFKSATTSPPTPPLPQRRAPFCRLRVERPERLARPVPAAPSLERLSADSGSPGLAGETHCATPGLSGGAEDGRKPNSESGWVDHGGANARRRSSRDRRHSRFLLRGGGANGALCTALGAGVFWTGGADCIDV